MSDLHPDYPKLMVVIAIAAALGVIYLLNNRKPTTRGSAAWLGFWWACIKGVFVEGDILIGDWSWFIRLRAFYNGPSNILTVGAPGSMKGIGSLIPNALRAPFLFLFDPGGEISAVCVKHWRAKGYAVDIINPWGLFSDKPHDLTSSGFNPLEFLDPKSDSFKDDALALASAMVPRRDGNAVAEHFTAKSFGGYQAFLMHCREKEAPENQNLVQVRKYIRGNKANWVSLLDDMQASTNDVVKGQGNEWSIKMASSPREFDGILSTMEVATRWLDSDVVQQTLCRSGTRFANLKGYGENGKKLKGGVISVTIPLEYVESHAPLGALATACMLKTMMGGGKPRQRVLAIFDEFAALGKMDMVVNNLANMRKYGLRIQLVFQSIGQAMAIYGEHGWQRIEGCCELRQYLASWDDITSKHVSRATGTATVKEVVDDKRMNMVGRSLIMPEEVVQLRQSQQVVFMRNLRPMKLRIRPYWHRYDLHGRYHDNPYHKRTPFAPLTRVNGLLIRSFRFLLWLDAATFVGLVLAFAWSRL